MSEQRAKSKEQRARLRPRPFFLAAAAVTLGAFLVAWKYGSFVAGGSDSYGYLSQARLWAHGWPVQAEPLIKLANWPVADWTFSPLGYRPGVDRQSIVPVYSMGYPLIMAAMIRVFGSGAELFIVPLASACLVFCTMVLARRLGGEVAGLTSGVVLMTSPIVVFQSLQPMSDIPTACLWVLATALVVQRTRWSAAAAAVAVALAILVRPNLAPLGIALAGLAYADGARGDGKGPAKAGHYVPVALGTLIAVAATAFVYDRLYGTPYRSGYEGTEQLFQAGFLTTNLAQFSLWLIQTETILVVAAAVGAFLLHRRAGVSRAWAWYSAAFFGLTFLAYAFYRPFNDWTYLRFLLPAIPFLTITALSIPAKPWITVAVGAVLVAGHLYFLAPTHVLETGRHEQRYRQVAGYISQSMPKNAIFLTQQHSGSIRYYTGFKTVRWDWLPERFLDRALARLERLGYKPYIVVEDWEEPAFKKRFTRSRYGALDWEPTAEIPEQITTRIYDPSKR